MKKLTICVLSLIILVSCGQPSSNTNADIHIKESAIIVRTSKVWQNSKTIIVSFIDGDPKMKAEVELFANEWTVYANLNFKFYPTVNDIPTNQKPDILISFHKTGNNSAVGTDALVNNSQLGFSISLSQLNIDNINVRRGTILHEFGHAIGLEHEHQHIDRQFHINEEKGLEYCRSVYGFSEESCRLNIFTVKSGNDLYFSKYDPLSIMHYTLHAEFFTVPLKLRTNESLSLLDKIEIAKTYPGRMTEAEIISSHKALGIRVNETQFYKNCKITSMVSNKMRLNDAGNPVILKIKDYSFSSIAPGDFDYHFFWEDKEGLIIAAKNEKYCNLDSAELESFRIKASKERIKNQTYGNCYIPLHTDGSPDAGYCSSDFPYQIYGKSPLKNIDSACYPTFQAAIDSSKISKYCNMSDSELIELQNKTNAEFEASRSYGKCYVEKSTALGCGEKYPWFILNKELNKSVNGFCFSEPSGAIRDIKKQAQCAP